MSPTVAMASGIQRAGVSPSLIIYVMGRVSVSPSPSLLTDGPQNVIAILLRNIWTIC